MAQIAPSGRTGTVGELDHRDETTLQQAQPGEATDLVPLDPGEPDKCVQIGGSLTGPLRDELITPKAGQIKAEESLRRKADRHPRGGEETIGPDLLEKSMSWLSNVVWLRRATENGECASILPASTRLRRMTFPCPGLDFG
ncbi:hypothetical protein Nepgr_031355 [Nepenthes gracilis]|uniref:Uncharacterized protein n=1 Tax=Nepenthes gracilis TaxID=150966 RepID=A0AAD3THE2_NEPGR|nr:hypothetical protein Nepgr_031355 [Nepenthes gracilis]